MTEKRFTMGKDKGYWYIRDRLEDVYHRDMTLPNDIANVCYVLNEQHETIQSLKSEIKISDECETLSIENSLRLSDEIVKLEKENKQLKKEILWWKYRCGEDISGDM